MNPSSMRIAFGLGLVGLASQVSGHGAMVFPAPRSSHAQTLDDRNKCGSKDPYSKAGLYGGGEYCGVGCLGEACLYYQIGCYAGCPHCSEWGKDLYPTPADIKLANCTPMEPTLGGGDPAHEKELRTNNVDGLSERGDWTRPNPWRAPGHTGKGNLEFPTCGINSGGAQGFPNPPTTTKDVPKSGPGTMLPSIGNQATWTPGAIVNVSWALYANHGGGYSYRLCKKPANGDTVTEQCFQKIPLDFVGNATVIKYSDGSRPEFTIPAVTTSVGTYPAGSMWRKNPIPMCNCDLGFSCKASAEEQVAAAAAAAGKAYGPDPDDSTMFKPYPKSNFHPGQTSTICPTGVQYPSQWDYGLGGPPYYPGQAGPTVYEYEMVDQVKIPADLPSGDYMLNWRWDCEETPQVWNSCADITIA